MARDSMVFYRNFRDALAKLPPDIRLEAYEQIFAYALDDVEPEDGIAGAFAQTLVPTIDKNNKKYEDGKKGGRPSTNNQTETTTKPDQNHNETTPEPKCKSVRVEECKNVKCQGVSVPEGKDGALIEPERKRTPTASQKEPARRFHPPTVEEVEAYCRERGNNVDPERFVDFYASNGWKVGKNSMKDWRAAVRTWERRDDNKPQAPPGRVSALTEAQARHARLMQIAGGMT